MPSHSGDEDPGSRNDADIVRARPTTISGSGMTLCAMIGVVGGLMLGRLDLGDAGLLPRGEVVSIINRHGPWRYPAACVGRGVRMEV